MKSLSGRLHLGLSLSLLVIIGSAWILGREALYRSSEALLLSRLEHDARALVGAFGIAPCGEPHLGKEHLTPVYNQPYSGHYYALELQEEDRRILSRSLWDQDLEVRPLQIGETANWFVDGPDGQRLMVWGGSYRRLGHSFSLAVAQDVAFLEQELSNFERLFTAIAISGFLLTILVQHFVVRRAFLGLAPLYRDIERLEKGEAGHLTEDVPTEILPLVRKFNWVLGSFVKGIERSRKAAGNLAHALKGPLNLMVQYLDRGDPSIDPGVRKVLSEQVERVQGLMERNLRRARFAGDAGPGRRFDPEEELPVLARLLKRMHPDKSCIGFQVETTGPIAADREDMLELVGILLDNACKWAGGQVLCTVENRGGDLVISVEDDGPGCTEEQLKAISARGFRVDESVGGYGLGLSIAKEIVDLYGGRIEFERSKLLGGFLARVTLPLEASKNR